MSNISDIRALIQLAAHGQANYAETLDAIDELCQREQGREEKLVKLLGEAELLLDTAPIDGSSRIIGFKAWNEWTMKRLAWLKQLSHTLIVDMNRELAEENNPPTA